MQNKTEQQTNKNRSEISKYTKKQQIMKNTTEDKIKQGRGE